MKLVKLALSSMLLGLSLGAIAQTPAPLSPQYTRTYTMAEINTLAKPIDAINIKETVYCSFADTLSNPTSNIKRVFALNTDGTVTSKSLTYPKSASSSSVQVNATRTVTLHPAGNTVSISPAVSLVTNKQGFSNLAVSASGNTRVFSYVVEDKTKTVIATSSGFFFRIGTGTNYMKGC